MRHRNGGLNKAEYSPLELGSTGALKYVKRSAQRVCGVTVMLTHASAHARHK